MYDNNIDVALLQETFVKDENEKTLKGYNKIITKRQTARNGNIDNIQGGCLLALIKDNIQYSSNKDTNIQ